MVKKPVDKLSKYSDPTGEFSNKQLRLGEWYLRHKIFLGKVGVGLLIAWSIITIGSSLVIWAKYLIFDYVSDEQMFARQVAEFQNYTALQANYGAQPLDIGSIQVYESAPDNYDFIAIARNPNLRWVATIDYHFVYGSGETPVATTELPPATERPIAVFGYGSEQFPSGARLVVDNIKWRNVNAHRVADPEQYLSERLSFDFDNFSFQRPNSADGISVQSLSFDLSNNSAYGFWSPVFYVVLKNGRQTVGMIYLLEDKFKAGETRKIDLRYFGETLSVSGIEVFPVVNIFDDSVFLNPGE